MTDAFYDAIASWYDLEFEQFDSDLGLYLGYAGIVGGPILELGCGTGRLILPLAQAGYEVVGLDASAQMVERARARVDDQRATTCTVEVGDMRDLSRFGEGQFRLVYAAINTFLHLESRDDQLATLAAVRRVLHDDGILVLDLFHPTPGTLVQMDDRLTLDGSWSLPDGSRLERLSHRRLHVAEQRIETRLLYDLTQPDGGLRRSSVSYVMRYIHRFEMEGLLSEAAFALEGIYGSYQLDALDDAAAQMIVVAHRR